MKSLLVPLILLLLALLLETADAQNFPRRCCRAINMRPLCIRPCIPHRAVCRCGPSVAVDGTTRHPADEAWTERHLFDGQTLNGWIKSNFGGEGEIHVVDGQIVLDMGHGLTGIHLDSDKYPRTNFRLRLKAKRLEGEDMVCGVTFPVGDQFCSLIVGGWGGSTVGISSIDNRDASDNQTTRIMKLEHDVWYQIEIAVTGQRLICKIDGQVVVDLETAGKKLSLRGDCDIARPIAIFSFGTRVAIKDIVLSTSRTGDD